MPKIKTFMIILIFFLFIIILFIFFKPSKTSTISLNIKNKTYQLEVATTPSQHAIGLMNRKELCSKCGMIFIFPVELPQSFWMKNTFIPLDIIFLDKNGQVINIETGQPLSTALINSQRPAKFVIELNSGQSQQINLAANDTIKLPW